jgi:hypothetical protein
MTMIVVRVICRCSEPGSRHCSRHHVKCVCHTLLESIKPAVTVGCIKSILALVARRAGLSFYCSSKCDASAQLMLHTLGTGHCGAAAGHPIIADNLRLSSEKSQKSLANFSPVQRYGLMLAAGGGGNGNAQLNYHPGAGRRRLAGLCSGLPAA